MTNPIPHAGIIPHIVVDDAAKAIEFYKKAFGAEEICRMPMPDGGKIMHAEISIDGHHVYLADDFPEWCPDGTSRTPTKVGTTTATLHRYVKDCDAAIKKAEDAGATVAMPASDTFWGDRYGQVKDPFGHLWSLATHVADPTPEEMAAAAEKMFAGAHE